MSRFSPVVSCPLPHCTLWMKVTVCHLYLRSRDSVIKNRLITYIICNFLLGGFISSLSFIHLFNHLFISLWTYIYLFYSSGYNLHLFCSKCPGLGHQELFQLTLVPLTYPHHYGFWFLVVSTSLFSGTTDASSYTFPVPVLESAISSRIFGSSIK